MRRLLLAIALVAAAIAGACAWLLYTEAGFAWAIARLESVAGDALALDGARGSLSGGITLDRLRYARGDAAIECRDASLTLSPLSLLALAPRVSTLRCAGLAVTLAPDGAPAGPPVSLALPLRIEIADARIGRLAVRGAGDPVDVTGIAFSYTGSPGGHQVRNAAFEISGTLVTGDATIGAARPFPVEAAITARRAAAPAVELHATLDGSLEALQFTARASSAGAHVAMEGTASPFAALPIEALRAKLSGLDLRALDAGLPRTAIEGELTLARSSGGAASPSLTGLLSLANPLAGPVDRERLPVESLRATVRTDLAAAQLDGLRAGLGPAGGFTGRGELAPGRLVLKLKTDDFDLAGLHRRLRATRLAGSLEIAAGRETQSIDADLAEGGVRIAVQAQRAGNSVHLRDLHARARGGELRGQGRIALSGAQAFSAEATLAGFNPAAWGDFPEGAVSGRVSATGSLADRAIDAGFRLGPSRLRGAALSGSGRVSLRAARLSAARADLEWGGNRIELRGALGNRGDVLTARVDAARLTVLRADWSGRIHGTAQLSGRWRAPEVKFEIAGKDLAWSERYGAAAVTAKGEYSPQIDEPLRLVASAAGVRGPGWRLEGAGLDVDGTRKAHTALLRAHGKDLNLSARARGGWQAKGAWAGTLQQLENRGEFPVFLEAPVALEAAPGLLRLGAFAARIAGGRLDVRHLRYEEGRIASDGQFSELRAAAALALAGLDPGAGGTLQLSGAWSLTSSPRWNGTVTLRRDSGDLPLGGQNTASLGLERLALDARVVSDRVEFTGALQSRVVTGRIEGSLLPVETPEGPRMAAASPLKFAATLEVARLAGLAGTAESALRFDGRLRATLTGGGTLGDPLVSGEVEGDELSVSLPAEGVALRAGILRAELSGREVRVRSFSIIGGEGVFRARGTLTRGKEDRAAVEWEAERLQVMGRPDRRLVVTGRGNAALEGGKLSLSGALRADEGLIELRAATLPAPGDDVVVVGRPRGPAQAPQLRRAALDLALDFGENVRIRGRGLDSLLAGKIRIQSGASGNLLATGTVNTVRGTYMAFGQRLELERGRLVFEGAIENPALDIRAMRKMPAVEAGVEVAGTLQSPFVRVVSEPPMPENDALSWLILGHGPGEAAGADLSMLPAAAAALLGQTESPGTGVARRLGLDSIGLRRGGTVGNQFVTVGKRISEDIYIVYEQSLGATANVLKLEFTLTRRVLMRAETGETSALGIFYRWAFD